MRWIALVAFLGLCGTIAAEEAADSADGVPPSPVPHVETKLSLDECVALALVSHPRLVEFNARISEAQGVAVQAGLYPNPRVDSGNPQTIGPNRTGVYTIGLTQEVVRGGKLQL